MVPKIIPVILSGGAGTRLWPVSRRSFPKQFWPLVGEQTLIQQTALRGQALTETPPIVVCNAAHRFVVAAQLQQIGIDRARVVLEPQARNSAPAIAAAACLVAESDPDAIMWIMAADALISDIDTLGSCLDQAVGAARQGFITTFGIKPTRPETGFGYIEKADPLAVGPSASGGVFRVKRFVEKPDTKTSERFFQDGQMLWNSGMFVAQASTFIDAFQSLVPEVWAPVAESVRHRTRDLDFERLEQKSFAQAPAISVDYAVAEKTDRAAVVESHFEWSDIGNWDAVWDALPKDDAGNATQGDVILQDAHNCLVRSDGPLVALRSIRDLIVVATDDAIMVSHRAEGQGIGQIVRALQDAGHEAATSHRRCYRPWGHYTSLARGEAFQVKQIVVLPQAQLSLQRHRHRSEHWVVVSGVAQVIRGEDQLVLQANESVYIPAGTVHRLQNSEAEPLIVIEVQTGTYLEEDDIERLDDIYARGR